MKFRLTSDERKKVHLDIEKINLYASRYKPHTQFDFEMTRRQAVKSDPMRKYYFSTVLPPFMEETGYEKDELELFHRQLKKRYFQCKADKRGIYRNVPSVFGNKSTLAVSKKKEFVEWVIRKAAIDGVYIPDPNEK